MWNKPWTIGFRVASVLLLGIALFDGIGCGITQAPSSAQTEYMDWVATAKPKDVDEIIERYPRLDGILMTAREWWEKQQKQREQSRIESGGEVSRSLYEFQVGTRINISVMGEEDISGTYKVDPDGAISLPFIGRLFVEGLTYPEVKQKIEEKLQKYIRDPMISINLSAGNQLSRGIRSSGSSVGSITVIGAGGGGGGGGGGSSRESVAGNERLVDVVGNVIGDSGGGRNAAEVRGIKVFVPQEGKTHSKIIICDLHRYLKYGDQTQNIKIRPGWVVYVPTRWTRWSQYRQDLSAITGILSESRSSFETILDIAEQPIRNDNIGDDDDND